MWNFDYKVETDGGIEWVTGVLERSLNGRKGCVHIAVKIWGGWKRGSGRFGKPAAAECVAG